MAEAKEEEEGDEGRVVEDSRGGAGNGAWRVWSRGRDETELYFEDVPCGC